MNDILLQISKNPQARNLVKALGLPIPIPQDLRRARTAVGERPLKDRQVAVYAPLGSPLLHVLATTLAQAGADPHSSDADTLAAFRGPGEAFGRPPAVLDLEDKSSFDGLVCDATGIDSPARLRALYDFFHPLMRRVGRSGRVVVVGRPVMSQSTSHAAAAQGALEGFVRSVAKEVGKKGATAQLVLVEPGAEERIAGTLRFLLSERSAYVTGQTLTVSARAKASDGTGWVRALDQKVALVTGAARGIGAATARILANEGATVVCLDRPADDGPTSKLAREIGGDPLLVDVTDEDAHVRIAEALMARHGGVDIVVHNAGITRDKTLARMKESWWDQAIAVNLTAVDCITDHLITSGTLRDGANVVCLSSIAGIAGNLGQTNYAASKAGIIGLVEHLAGQVAQRGITVNAIAPGFIETRLTEAMPFALREVARRMNSLGQGGRPVDVGQAIMFLSHPDSQGITGQCLRVCGGSLVGR